MFLEEKYESINGERGVSEFHLIHTSKPIEIIKTNTQNSDSYIIERIVESSVMNNNSTLYVSPFVKMLPLTEKLMEESKTQGVSFEQSQAVISIMSKAYEAHFAQNAKRDIKKELSELAKQGNPVSLLVIAGDSSIDLEIVEEISDEEDVEIIVEIND